VAQRDRFVVAHGGHNAQLYLWLSFNYEFAPRKYPLALVLASSLAKA